MKKTQICALTLTATLMLSFISIISIQPASADAPTPQTKYIATTGLWWYYWEPQNPDFMDPNACRHSAIILYDGSISQYYVTINSIDSQNTTARWDLINNLYDQGYAILTPKDNSITYSSSNNAWLLAAAVWLQRGCNYPPWPTAYPLVTLFGWGAGGTAVGYEIQKEGVEDVYSCAVIADALVNFPFPGLDAIYYTATTADNTKVPTAFICNQNDAEYEIYGYKLAYPGMSTYYSNMPGGLAKEWHLNWGDSQNPADYHDPFPDTCLTHSGETVSDVVYNWEITVEGYDSIESIDGRNWYYWNCSSDSVAILLFGGPANVSYNKVWSKAFYFPDELDFIHQLHARGIDILSLTNEENWYTTSSTWLNETADELKNGDYDYDNVYLFGHSAGGVVVGCEIQRPGADDLYDAAVMASAPVNYSSQSLFTTAQTAQNTKVQTAFICHCNDTIMGNHSAQMQDYYDNMPAGLAKGWHLNWGWTDDDPNPHDVFPDQCLTHTGETVTDAVYNAFLSPVQLTVQAWNQYSQPGYGISVHIDEQYVGTTFNTFTVMQGLRKIEVESPVGTSVFDHYQWSSGSSDDNPMILSVTSTETLYAWYWTY